jgi:hypothetical protein
VHNTPFEKHPGEMIYDMRGFGPAYILFFKLSYIYYYYEYMGEYNKNTTQKFISDTRKFVGSSGRTVKAKPTEKE